MEITKEFLLDLVNKVRYLLDDCICKSEDYNQVDSIITELESLLGMEVDNV